MAEGDLFTTGPDSGLYTNAYDEGETNLATLRAKQARIGAATALADLEREKAQKQIDDLNDPTLAQIEGEKKNAALEAVLPVGPSGAPESKIEAQVPDTSGLYGGGERGLTVSGGEVIPMAPGVEAPSRPMPRRGDQLKTLLTPEFQLADMERGIRQLDTAIQHNDTIVKSHKVFENGAWRPASPEEVSAATQRRDAHMAARERAMAEYEKFAPAIRGHQLYPAPNMYGALGGIMGGAPAAPSATPAPAIPVSPEFGSQ